MRHTLIIGGGYTALAAAYDLARAGRQVTILEREHDIGGLAGTFTPRPGVTLEKFYHHWFTSDTAVLDLIRELGLEEKLLACSTRTGLYYANSTFRLASPLDLLRFPAIPIIDRIRTGLMALRARSISEWHGLEEISAEEWLIRHGGRRAFEVIWSPLLHGKFGSEASEVSAVWIWNKLKLRGSSRNKKGGETLIYFRGGFGAVSEALRASLQERGVTIELGVSAQKILCEGERVVGVESSRGRIDADEVLVTTPLPHLLELYDDCPPAERERWSEIRFLGNVCLVLRLKRSLSSTYWLNVADPTFPFVGVIEHTNLDDPSHYGGEHIAYLSKYLARSDPLYTMSEDETLQFALPHLTKMFPEFSREWIIGAHLWRAPYSQPVITKHYSALIPPFKMPHRNLWLCTMAQVYPQDRGTNYAVAYGRRVAREMLAER